MKVWPRIKLQTALTLCVVFVYWRVSIGIWDIQKNLVGGKYIIDENVIKNVIAFIALSRCHSPRFMIVCISRVDKKRVYFCHSPLNLKIAPSQARFAENQGHQGPPCLVFKLWGNF